MKKYIACTIGLFMIILLSFSLYLKRNSLFSQAEMLAGKWSVIEIISKRVENNKTVLTKKYIGNPDDYMTFGNHNKVYFLINNVTDIAHYTLMKENKILYNGDTSMIKKLTPQICVLAFRNEDSKNTYNEKVIILKKAK